MSAAGKPTASRELLGAAALRRWQLVDHVRLGHQRTDLHPGGKARIGVLEDHLSSAAKRLGLGRSHPGHVAAHEPDGSPCRLEQLHDGFAEGRLA